MVISYRRFRTTSQTHLQRSGVVYFAAVVHTYQVPVSISLMAFGSVPVIQCYKNYELQE